jgi:NodT family efflux transporter outer membrane factor (OMF) lipoprotein
MKLPWKALLAAGLLTACAAVGPDYEQPEIATPATFGAGAAESVDAEQIAQWWRGFGDEQLSRLVDEVLGQNLDLASAVERIEVARASYGISRADFFPQVSGSATYRRGRQFPFDPTADQYTVGLSTSWEIDLFGRVRRSVQSALANFEAQIEDYHGVRLALVVETVSTYLQALSLAERLGIATQNVGSQEKSLEIAELRFDAGMANGLDPAQARVNLHSTQANVPALRFELTRTLHRLSVLTAREPRALLEEITTDVPLPEVPAEILVGIPADLLRNRPDLRGLERQLEAQSARVGVATASLYPAIQISGSWDWLALEPENLFEEEGGFGLTGPVVSLPLFTAGRLRAAIDAEEATLRQLHLQLHQQALVAQEEVENALVAVVNDRRRLQLLDEASVAAQESVDLVRELYTSGQTDFQNVLDAQRSQFSLEDQRAQAKLLVLLDLVDVYRSIGGGWAEVAEPEGPSEAMGTAGEGSSGE